MTFTIRPYQQEAVDAMNGEFEPASNTIDQAEPVEMEFE